MSPGRAIKPRTVLHSERSSECIYAQCQTVFFFFCFSFFLRPPHFFCLRKKWQRCHHHPHGHWAWQRAAESQWSSTKEQLMRNCRCIIAEHATGAAAGHKEAINAAQMRLACIKMLNPSTCQLPKSAKNCSSKSKSKAKLLTIWTRAGKHNCNYIRNDSSSSREREEAAVHTYIVDASTQCQQFKP